MGPLVFKTSGAAPGVARWVRLPCAPASSSTRRLYILAGNAINDGAESGAPFVGLVLVVATVSTLVALVGLSAFQARRYPALIWAAFGVPAVGAIVALVGAVAVADIGDSDRAIVAGLSAWAISTLGVLGLLVGSGLSAVGTWLARSLSRGAAAHASGNRLPVDRRSARCLGWARGRHRRHHHAG